MAVIAVSGVVATVAGLLAAAAATTPAGSALVPEPRGLWHVEGEGRGTPAVYGNTVYFLSKRHVVVAIDAETGSERWRRQTNEAGDSTNGSAIETTRDG